MRVGSAARLAPFLFGTPPSANRVATRAQAHSVHRRNRSHQHRPRGHRQGARRSRHDPDPPRPPTDLPAARGSPRREPAVPRSNHCNALEQRPRLTHRHRVDRAQIKSSWWGQLKLTFLIRSVARPARVRAGWLIRWKPVLNAFAIDFLGRHLSNHQLTINACWCARNGPSPLWRTPS